MKKNKTTLEVQLCAFLVLLFSRRMEKNDWKKKPLFTINFFLFMSGIDGLSPSCFQGVHMNKNPFLEGLLLLNILL